MKGQTKKPGTSRMKKPGPKPPEEDQIPLRLAIPKSMRDSIMNLSDSWNVSVSEIVRNACYYLLSLDTASQRDILFPLHKVKK